MFRRFAQGTVKYVQATTGLFRKQWRSDGPAEPVFDLFNPLEGNTEREAMLQKAVWDGDLTKEQANVVMKLHFKIHRDYKERVLSGDLELGHEPHFEFQGLIDMVKEPGFVDMTLETPIEAIVRAERESSQSSASIKP